MKKYITTDKHPFGEGHIIVKNDFDTWPKFEYKFPDDPGVTGYIEIKHLGSYKRLDWIKEIQKPKWTDDDMIEFIKFYNSHDDEDQLYLDQVFNKFKQSKQ